MSEISQSANRGASFSHLKLCSRGSYRLFTGHIPRLGRGDERRDTNALSCSIKCPWSACLCGAAVRTHGEGCGPPWVFKKTAVKGGPVTLNPVPAPSPPPAPWGSVAAPEQGHVPRKIQALCGSHSSAGSHTPWKQKQAEAGEEFSLVLPREAQRAEPG